MNNYIAEKIKQARMSAGLSQKELAKKLDLSEKTISAYEKERAIPPSPTLQKIADITDKPLQFFSNKQNQVTIEDIGKKLDIIIEELKKINDKK